MRRDKRIHERLEVGPPPLRKRIANAPLIIHALARELRADRRKALVQPRLEALDLIILGLEVVARSIPALVAKLRMCITNVQLEERVCNLQHQNVGMVVFVADQHALARPPHAMLLVVFFQPLQSRKHRRIFFWLAIFGAECVVAEGVEADRLRLVCVEVFGECGPAGVSMDRAIWLEKPTGTSFVKLAG
jgi:hypothetical protein